MLTQEQLYELSSKLYDDIEFLLDRLKIDYKIAGNRYTGQCPIHQGDNDSAFCCSNGTWTCFTHHCEKTFAKNMIGLVRGVLSNQIGWTSPSDKMATFESTLKWIFSFLKIDESSIKSYKTESTFITTSKILSKTRQVNEKRITREQVREKLDFPAIPLLKRGFSEEILDSYDVGICKPHREMSGRIVVPIYDDDHKWLVAALGRSIYDQCKTCKLYHDGKCPQNYFHQYSKWTNSEGFHKGSYLFNYWKVKEELKRGKVLLVEGPLDVIRLEMFGIKNSVGLFGSSISDEQTILLEKFPLQHIIVLTDNDEAGSLAKIKIKEQCRHLCPIHFPSFTSPDPGSMTEKEIIELKQFIDKLGE